MQNNILRHLKSKAIFEKKKLVFDNRVALSRFSSHFGQHSYYHVNIPFRCDTNIP